MQAIILSAGFGTRLKQFTDKMPKVMVPIDGRPLLEHHIEQLKEYGVRDILINLHYLPDIITDYFGDGLKFGVKILYKYETEILGTAGGIKNFENEIKDSFFVVYGDVLNFINYSKFEEYFCKKPNAIGVEIIGKTDHPYDSDLVEIDANLKFLKIYRMG